MHIRKSIVIVLAVAGIASGWLAKTVAQQSASSTGATYFEHEKVEASFAKNGVLFGGESGSAKYKVLTATRDRAGEAEIHNLDTDVIHILSGTATFVTGGTAVEKKTTAPDEIRGRSIQGGDSRHLSKGDVIIVPHGVPHWFKEVRPPFQYFVVKVH